MKKFILIFLCGISLLVSSLHAASTGSQTLLLQGEQLRQELTLTKKQCNALDQLRADYRKEIQPFLAQADAKAANMLDSTTQKFDKKALSILSPAQKTKLKQLEYKILGPWILHTPSVQEQLSLTNRQKQQVAHVATKMTNYTNCLNKKVAAGKMTPADRLNKLRIYRLQQGQVLEKILMPQQLQAMKAKSNSPA